MTSSRQTIAALDKLEAVLNDAATEVNRLLARVSRLREQLEAGERLSELMDSAPRPLIIEGLTGLLDRLGDASSALRRAEAQQLFAEGFSRTRIAEAFGVSRQRATILLTRARPATARATKERPDSGNRG
jgi:hypothetical protein